MLAHLTYFLDDNDISYHIIAGTLLGAVRHKGFIPWDDDIDIAIKRKDYDRLLKTFKNCDLFFLQSWHSDENYGQPFCKLRLNNSIYQEYSAKKTDIHHGIYIDIFPLDEVSQNKFVYMLQKYLGSCLQKIISIKSKYIYEESKFKKAIKLLIFYITFLVKKKCLIQSFEFINKYLSRYNSSNRLVCTGGSYGFNKEIVYKEWFNSFKLIPFENIMVKAPCNYTDYLKNLYGDYNKLPSVNNRVGRHRVLVKKISISQYNLLKK
ncbi:LicD family protein [Exiguobacterium sp. FSL W8-0210]|uniref:LicD family protein n=1 Tax=Exiguobacterium sp. FSL W8-0210 TaxID=2921598 RepID=UPI0030F767A1